MQDEVILRRKKIGYAIFTWFFGMVIAFPSLVLWCTAIQQVIERNLLAAAVALALAYFFTVLSAVLLSDTKKKLVLGCDGIRVMYRDFWTLRRHTSMCPWSNIDKVLVKLKHGKETPVVLVKANGFRWNAFYGFADADLAMPVIRQNIDDDRIVAFFPRRIGVER